MPFTPFHFGPHACIALPFNRYIDIPIFIGTNIIIDIEPLLVLQFNLDYPLHGYYHTFLIGGLVGLLFASAAFPFRHYIKKGMNLLRLPYGSTFKKMAISGVLGAWLHVLFDAPLYSDIRPFYPLQENPLFGIVSHSAVYSFCGICLLLALLMYFFIASIIKRKKEKSHI